MSVPHVTLSDKGAARVRVDTESAARLMHGEADLLPGLIVDRYADVLVLQTAAPALDRREAMIAELLRERTEARLVVSCNDGSARDFEGLPRRIGVLAGDGPTLVRYRDAGSLVEVDVLSDGKTGGFLDQLANHEVAARYARGECLDAFTYHGGFALALCEGSARSGNLRALRIASADAVVVSCSCSGRVDGAAFGDMLAAAARTVQVLERRGAGTDHPVLLGVPETEYLKCHVLRVIA